MSFPRYPGYKDSGVEWLREVPAHWETIPLSRTASEHESLFIDGDWIESKDLSDDGIRYLTSGNVGDGYYKEQGHGYISEETFTALNCVEVLPGDVLISRLNLPIGRSCLVPDLGGRIVTCVDNVIVRTDPNFDRRFFVYQLTSKSHFANMENLARGTTMQRISRSVLGRVRFAFPPLQEQTQIAAFLDDETAKIDALVAEQRQLMDLLKEKRQAVISHAVTRGLNPDAPMKPSGIEWLGDLPEHWEVKRLRDVAQLNPSKTEIAELDRDTFVSFLPMSAIGEGGTLNLESEKPIRELESGYTYFRDGDVTIAKITPCYENGKGALMRGLTQGVGFGTTELIVVRPKFDESCGEFLHFLFVSNVFRDIGESHMYGAGGQKRVPDDFVRNFSTGFPPVSEQIAIAAYLDAELEKFDTLTAEAQRAIDLLQERRAALISAAVTGQIDVRNEVS